MNLANVWEETLTLLEKSLSEVIFTSLISTLRPVELANNVLTLEITDDFLKTIVDSRYLYEITRCVKTLTDMDIEVKLVSPEDNLSKRNAMEYAKTNLRKKYNFDTFVQGKSNELAYAAALAVAESPGQSAYNPLFLYGGVGLGKTHLVHSIGNYALERFPDINILYQSMEAFTNELIAAIRDRSTQAFKNKYRKCDILLLDDIQFLGRTVETQEEMFHTFNTLYDDNKQIVLTSDLSPMELSNVAKPIEKRLTTRFGMGLIVDVTLPDYETRAAILEKKLALERLIIPNPVKEYIIRNIDSNIRDLEGALNKVTAYARFSNTPITLELAEKALKDQIEGSREKVVTIEYIQEIVSKHYNITLSDLNGRRRKKNIVVPRQIAMYLSHKIMTSTSLPEIGKAFGNRDYTTVIHSCEKIIEELKINTALQDDILDLERHITGKDF
ncbi:MAG: chromosomal replication initiator protein DnaA [Turicibacter sp.]|nr:chromosomal replication initiator protein DnaA [Turicibacter sp.]